MKAKSNNYFEGYSNMESILALQIHGFPWDQMFIIQIQTLNKCTTHSKTKKKASKTISKLQKKKRNLWLLFKVSLVKAVDVLGKADTLMRPNLGPIDILRFFKQRKERTQCISICRFFGPSFVRNHFFRGFFFCFIKQMFINACFSTVV